MAAGRRTCSHPSCSADAMYWDDQTSRGWCWPHKPRIELDGGETHMPDEACSLGMMEMLAEDLAREPDHPLNVALVVLRYMQGVDFQLCHDFGVEDEA